MFLGKPVWYAMCLRCGFREVQKVFRISPPASCPDCQTRARQHFPVKYGRYQPDRRIYREDTGQLTDPIPLGVSRVM